MLKHLLVGYDGSESSQQAFRLAMEMARANQGRVLVASILQVVEGGDTCALMMTETAEQRTRDLVDELKAIAPDTSSLVDAEIAFGSPGDVLLSLVKQHHIDHIVIGHTGRGTLARWLLGSVSDDVLSRAHVPVTVVR
ncbi:universal stress protein [Dyella sp. A6]|uniref:universal stress protein n=1 Tax=Dyella aluminiiresistens TaxID=3069105 RepID=UPI002E7A2ADD|nr:universal stress protein [Dyella sp. A6]